MKIRQIIFLKPTFLKGNTFDRFVLFILVAKKPHIKNAVIDVRLPMILTGTLSKLLPMYLFPITEKNNREIAGEIIENKTAQKKTERPVTVYTLLN